MRLWGERGLFVVRVGQRSVSVQVLAACDAAAGVPVSERLLVTLVSVTLLCAMFGLGLLVAWRAIESFHGMFG